MKKIKVLSLFDGISVAQQALKELGYDVEYYASEIDKYAIQITQKNHPMTIQIGDVKHIGIGDDISFFQDEKIDLLIGGSPCQDLSIAKKNREGLKGSRSSLFYEYGRILKEVKPKYFILENVNSMPKEAKEIITKELFGIEPVMINASLVSAQNRKRLFWVGRREVVNPNRADAEITYVKVDVPQPEDRGILLKDILEENVDEKYFLHKDDKLTPSTNPDIEGTLDTGTWSKRYEQIRRVYKISGKAPTLPTGTGGGVITKIAIPVALRNRGEGKKPEYNGTEKANSLTTVQTDSMVDMPPIRKLTPVECERLQSLPDSYTEGVSDTQRYKALGNAFNKEVVKHILSFIQL